MPVGMAQSSQPTLDEGDTAVIRFWDDQTRESMGTQGEMGIPITVFNSERSLRVSQGRGQTLQGEGDGTYRLQMQADFRRVQGKLSKSAGSGKRKDVQGSSSPRASRQRYYYPGVKDRWSRLLSGARAQTAGGRLPRSDTPSAGVALGPVPPAAGAGSRGAQMLAAQRGLWVRARLPSPSALAPDPTLLGPL